MLRQFSSACSVACATACRRRLLATKSSLCSTTHVVYSGRNFSSTASPSQPPQQDDFFVDIDSLAGFGEAAVNATTSGAPQTPNAFEKNGSPSTFSANDASAEVLGVVRHTPEEEGARYSRLQIPLPPKEGGASSAPSRSNTRAGLRMGEEATYADQSSGPTNEFAPSSATTATSASLDAEVSALERMQFDGASEGAAAEQDSRLPDPERLPYDDERFAEMLLEMEVNGVVDEAWQDAHKAHLEDVKEIADILASLKVRDICCIDVSEKTSNFDYMMFGTCEGARHIHLAAWAAQDADKAHRISKIKRKQTDELWEVVPIGRIVLNLMVESFREEMSLERKWAVTRTMDPLAAANAPISEGRQVKAHGLWTLTLNLQDLEDFEVDYCKDILMRQM